MAPLIKAPFRYRRMAKLYASELGLTDCCIEIKRVRFSNENVLAACRRLGPHHYLIRVSKKAWRLAKHPVPEIIAHEFVHIEQYESGRMLDVEGDDGEYRVIWEGVDYGSDPEPGNDEHWEMPWEEEAYRKQKELYERWLKL